MCIGKLPSRHAQLNASAVIRERPRSCDTRVAPEKNSLRNSVYRRLNSADCQTSQLSATVMDRIQAGLTFPYVELTFVDIFFDLSCTASSSPINRANNIRNFIIDTF